MVRTEDDVNRNAGESQSLIRFWSRNIEGEWGTGGQGRPRQARKVAALLLEFPHSSTHDAQVRVTQPISGRHGPP
eukprot:COSAG01_NODE_20734_length_938_cov_0.943981_1_plen_75_part_00